LCIAPFLSKLYNMIILTTAITIILLTLSIIPHPSLSYSIARQVTANSKAGLAWPNGPWVDIQQYRTTGKVSWYYSWSPTGFDTDLEFVPMLWGPTQVDQFSTTINQTISQKNVSAVLGMNEPQQTGQSNLSPQDGVQMWRTYLEPLKAQGMRLGSPAPSSAPSGKVWIQQFLEACAGNCTVDFIALHWYDVNATQFKLYLTDFYTTFQRPIWVTEWACQNYNNASAQCSPSDIVTFLNETQSFMDETPWVERYAWFGMMENMQGVNEADAMMDKNGKINDLGRQYIGALTPVITGGVTALSVGTGIISPLLTIWSAVTIVAMILF